MKAQEIMSRNPTCVTPETPLAEAARKAETLLASVQATNAAAQAQSQTLQAKVDQLIVQVNETTQARAANEAERAKAGEHWNFQRANSRSCVT